MVECAHCSHYYIDNNILLSEASLLAIIHYREHVEVPYDLTGEELGVSKFHGFEEEWLRKGGEHGHEELLSLKMIGEHLDVLAFDGICNSNVDPPFIGSNLGKILLKELKSRLVVVNTSFSSHPLCNSAW